jgi:GT2 family glycosyltransferase
MPKVSVIIPTYNRYKFLSEAIESVLNQQYQDYELIVVDDGSTDDTAQIAQKYNSKISYIYQENRGVSAARNRGLACSSGEYLCFLDSDDVWQPGKLKTQVEFMERHLEYQISYTDEVWIRNGVRVNQRRKHRKYGGWILPYCLPLCIISPSSVMIKRGLFDVVGKFDESLPACEDYDLWLRIARDYPIGFIEQPLIIKRGGHADQLSRKYYGIDRFRIVALEKLLAAGNLSPKHERLVKEQLAIKCRIYAQGCYKRGKQAEGDIYLRKVANLG